MLRHTHLNPFNHSTVLNNFKCIRKGAKGVQMIATKGVYIIKGNIMHVKILYIIKI